MGAPIRHFSQNDEDGITLRILDRLGLQPSIFLELGSGDGTENNTLLLLALKWSGGWIDGKPLAFPINHSRVNFVQEWVTRDNCVTLAKQALSGRALHDVRLASVDLDGNDYHLVNKLLSAGLAPDVFIVEYNAKFPATVEFVMPYDDQHIWTLHEDYFGASLKSWSLLFAQANYQLVACNLTGVNAFFVKKEHMNLFTDIPRDISSLYQPGTYFPLPISGHRLSSKTIARIIRDD